MSDGSLRIVRNGIGINEAATVDLPGIKVASEARESEAEADGSGNGYLFVRFSGFVAGGPRVTPDIAQDVQGQNF